MRGVRFVFAVAVVAMLAVAAGAAIAQDETLLPANGDEGTVPEGQGGKDTDVQTSPEVSSLPPTPSLASEGISVSGDPTSGYETSDGTRVPAGAVSGGLARLPATGGATKYFGEV